MTQKKLVLFTHSSSEISSKIQREVQAISKFLSEPLITEIVITPEENSIFMDMRFKTGTRLIKINVALS